MPGALCGAMVGAEPTVAILMVSVASVLPLAFVARTVTAVLPATVGVPVIAPEMLMLSPAGNVGVPTIEKLVAPVATT